MYRKAGTFEGWELTIVKGMLGEGGGIVQGEEKCSCCVTASEIMDVEKSCHIAQRGYACMVYAYMVITYSRAWINRVRLPILLVVS